MLRYKKFTILLSIFFCTVTYTMSCEDNLDSVAVVSKQAGVPLNILFVVSYFPSPSQIFVLNIITGLIDKGHNVSIFSFHKNKSSFVHQNVNKYNLLQCVTYEKFAKNLPDYDIIFCQFGYLAKRIFKMDALAQWLKKRKVVVCFRGADTSVFVQNNPEFYKRVFKKGDLFLPVCNYFKERLIRLGCNPNKIVVHHSAINCSQFFFQIRERPDKDIIHVVSVCRLIKKKGIDYAIKAVAQVAQKYPDIHFTIIGDGPERKNLELLVKKMKLQDKITFHGWLAQDQVVSILNRSHIFLLPSRTSSDGNEEGIANALKEAMAMGLISVATWHAGTSELIDDGVSGFLVPEKSTFKLAKTIEYVIEHSEVWEAVGLAARKKVEDEFEMGKAIQQLEELFYSLLGYLG